MPFAYVTYSVSRPGPDGTPSSVERWLRGFDHLSDTWEERNDIRTRLIEQAAHDKHLLTYGRNMHIELKMPEYVFRPPLLRSSPTVVPKCVDADQPDPDSSTPAARATSPRATTRTSTTSPSTTGRLTRRRRSGRSRCS